MVDMVTSMIGNRGAPLSARALMIGDRYDTDGLFARTLGCRFALVRSGVSAPGAAIDAATPVDLDVADLAAVSRRLVHAGPGRE
jgi:ribonucleotide monophosphatase NagD (HAD superfamily)